MWYRCLRPHTLKTTAATGIPLTSHLMETLGRLVLAHLHPVVRTMMQFAYQSSIRVDDAGRIMLFDFSSVFNTIQSTLLRDKLKMDLHLTSWIVDYLTIQPQYMRTKDCVSDMVNLRTGTPQGTVLAPFLFTLNTVDLFYCSPSCHLQTFSADSAKGTAISYRSSYSGACGTTSRLMNE